MSVENFLKLKEIDSLSKERIKHLKHKQEQEDRLSKLNTRQQESYLQTEKLQKEMRDINSSMADVEKKLKTASDQRQRIQDYGGDEKKADQFAKDIEALENQGLELLEELSLKETELKEIKEFLKGLEKTTEEIKVEAQGEIAVLDKEISNLEMRVSLLKEELPADFRSLLEKVTAKNLAHGPFTRIESGSCFFCRYKISRMDESEVDMQKGLKQCPQCSRIFLPYGA